MKKLFTLLMAICFVATLSAQQQLQKTAQNVQSSNIIEKAEFPPMTKANARIILKAGDVWGDGTGYQMLLDVTHSLFGTTIPTTGPLTTGGDVPASVYAQFSHKIPANADGALNTTNMILNGQGYVDVPSGLYDYCITNPSPATPPYNVMWIAGSPLSRGDDYNFISNMFYTFELVRNGNNDSTIVNSSTVSIAEISATNLLIYPNPAKTNLTITAFSNIQSVEIYNIVGQLVTSENFNAELVNVNINDLSDGLYIAKVITIDGIMTKKFNVAR